MPSVFLVQAQCGDGARAGMAGRLTGACPSLDHAVKRHLLVVSGCKIDPIERIAFTCGAFRVICSTIDRRRRPSRDEIPRRPNVGHVGLPSACLASVDDPVRRLLRILVRRPSLGHKLKLCSAIEILAALCERGQRVSLSQLRVWVSLSDRYGRQTRAEISPTPTFLALDLTSARPTLVHASVEPPKTMAESRAIGWLSGSPGGRADVCLLKGG